MLKLFKKKKKEKRYMISKQKLHDENPYLKYDDHGKIKKSKLK